MEEKEIVVITASAKTANTFQFNLIVCTQRNNNQIKTKTGGLEKTLKARSRRQKIEIELLLPTELNGGPRERPRGSLHYVTGEIVNAFLNYKQSVIRHELFTCDENHSS